MIQLLSNRLLDLYMRNITGNYSATFKTTLQVNPLATQLLMMSQSLSRWEKMKCKATCMHPIVQRMMPKTEEKCKAIAMLHRPNVQEIQS